MNLVVVAPNFYPQQDAEAYCSTRFASALAATGHTVEVVTVWRPDEMCEKSYPQLLHPNVKITRVSPCVVKPMRWPYVNMRWWTAFEGDDDSIAPYIAATRAALARYERPILVTRTYPWLSLYVGWHCRKYAAKWIQHFSDPMIDFEPWCRMAYLRLWSLKWWMRRAMRKADAISVTCKRVRWYYREQLGPCVDQAKFILTTHIGDFKLESGGVGVGVGVERIIYHDGDIYGGRGLLMVDAVERLNDEGFACEFLQGRDVNRAEDRARLLASSHCKIVGKGASPELKALAKSAPVSFVADFDTPGLSYSPFLMSKFVYQLFNDKPMVVLSKVESEKHDYCVEYPEAGLFFAEIGNVESLMSAIKAAFACDPAKIDRERIRKTFSEESIARHFVDSAEGRSLSLKFEV